MPKARTQTEAAAPAPIPESHDTSALPMSYDVRIHTVKMNGTTRGNASVTVNGQFGIRGVNVREGQNGLFVSMPSWKDGNGEYHDICFPCTKESRATFDKAVLSAFEQTRLQAGAGTAPQTPSETLPIEYDVRVHSLHPGAGTLKGTASVNINDQFAIRSVKIMEGSKGLFASTPGFKGGNGMFKDYCYPITKEAREAFNQAVADAYRQALTQSQVAGQNTAAPQQADTHATQGAPSMAPVMQM